MPDTLQQSSALRQSSAVPLGATNQCLVVLYYADSSNYGMLIEVPQGRGIADRRSLSQLSSGCSMQMIAIPAASTSVPFRNRSEKYIPVTGACP